ncbi:hypothetical protein BH780_gp231 [Bacillus phage Eldridge]|uniref:Uncharacterized protein n=1 Tax=Bacillus phage Eldridge TaxID=1776293 RepID=A0A0Y0AJQ6_9CAUD|nr:hypothetical protein BH780_gp001 [Bacillus phage Eldridge]YP_009274938.1 hypothetical protein BH780_gp231 [Bacillus phage Eldridge]AMB18589.1 hypothetical protein Eldridge_01 [Bacillus phage Eldridge]AMB18824.1 hypothetical protein Eldridge_0234 [Bacillus phage Eldridge]
MTVYNSIQHLIEQVKADRTQEVELGKIDIIDILERFEGYEAKTVKYTPYEVTYLESTDEWVINVGDTLIQDGFIDEEEADGVKEDLMEEDEGEPATAKEYLDYLYETDWITEQARGMSVNYNALVSNNFTWVVYYCDLSETILVEFKVRLSEGSTDTVLLEFEWDNHFFELIGEAEKWVDVEGNVVDFDNPHADYAIHVSALFGQYDIVLLPSYTHLEEEPTWERAVEAVQRHFEG